MRPAAYRPRVAADVPRAALPAKPYRYQGNPGWEPASLGPVTTEAEKYEERVREFTRHREEQGLGIGRAAAALGLSDRSGTSYERERLRRRGEAS
jgi:hypothetical protein